MKGVKGIKGIKISSYSLFIVHYTLILYSLCIMHYTLILYSLCIMHYAMCINKGYASIESMAALMSSKMPSMVPIPLMAL